MKKFNKIFLTLAAVLSFASCQEDLGLDVYENHLYMTSSERTKLLYVSTEHSYSEVINASIAKPAEEDVNILYDVDEDLVAVYNEIYHDNAVILPHENYYFSSYRDKINKGDVNSASITVEFSGTLTIEYAWENTTMLVKEELTSGVEYTFYDKAPSYFKLVNTGAEEAEIEQFDEDLQDS